MKLLRTLYAALLASWAHAGPRGNVPALIDTGLFYDEYLQAVIKILEKDDNLRLKMEEGDLSHLKIGSLTEFDEINELAQHLRDELDDLKRSEVERLRKLLKAQNKLNAGKKVNVAQLVEEVTGHIDASKADFGLKDLNRLITRVAHDMENFDEKRHIKFKEYEMHKVLEREEKMKDMNDYEKKQFEEDEKKKT